MRLAIAAASAMLLSTPARAEDAAAHPDLSGVWFTEQGAGVQISGFLSNDDAHRATQLPLIDLNAPWTDEARARFRERLSQAAISKSEGWGFPMMMASLTPLEFVVTPSEMLILTSYRDVRQVALDGRPLSAPEDRWVTAWGESVGHWDGDTLVIETTNFLDRTGVGMNGTGASDALKITERFRRTSDTILNYSLTINDPMTWTAPFTIRYNLERDDRYGMFEYACHEGNYALQNIMRGARVQERSTAGTPR